MSVQAAEFPNTEHFFFNFYIHKMIPCISQLLDKCGCSRRRTTATGGEFSLGIIYNDNKNNPTIISNLFTYHFISQTLQWNLFEPLRGIRQSLHTLYPQVGQGFPVFMMHPWLLMQLVQTRLPLNSVCLSLRISYSSRSQLERVMI